MKANLISKIVVLGLLSLTIYNANGQEATTVKDGGNYRDAIGLRAGQTSGLTYKHKFISNNAVEVILGTYPYAFSFTGLYEKYIPTGTNGLQWYLGGGGHIGAPMGGRYGYYVYDSEGRYYYTRTSWYGPALGLDGMIGIEYKIPRAPLAFSFDLKPYFEHIPGRGTYGNMDPGLGIKLAW